jgi:hypothetical protein
MSIVASSVVLVLFAIAAGLTLLAYALPQLRIPIATLGGAAALALGYYHTGGFGSPDPAMFPRFASLGPNGATAAGCERAIRLLEQNNVILDRSGPRTVIVNAALWAQIPPPTQDVLRTCFAPPDGSEGAVEIIER